MKRQLAAAFMVLGAACAAYGQGPTKDSEATSWNVATVFSPSANDNLMVAVPPAVPNFFSSTAVPPPSAPALSGTTSAAPEPTPSPEPKFLYGGRDDFRWQLGIGVDWIRFRSSIFNASAVGIASSVTYFTNEWFGVEGVVTTAFAPTIYANEHVKLLVYGAGPKIAWRERRWEPWMHAIFGGMHELPQTAGNSKNTYAIELGGGADYRINPRLSGRLEADWLHAGFFGQNQNNFELMGGVVFHF